MVSKERQILETFGDEVLKAKASSGSADPVVFVCLWHWVELSAHSAQLAEEERRELSRLLLSLTSAYFRTY